MVMWAPGPIPCATPVPILRTLATGTAAPAAVNAVWVHAHAHHAGTRTPAWIPALASPVGQRKSESLGQKKSKNRKKAADSMDGAQVVLLYRTVTRGLPVGVSAVFFAVAASEKDGGGNAYSVSTQRAVWVQILTSKSVLSRLSSALRTLVLR
ncbi:hypothetical protein BHE74_00045440 [Ensete ventricosum]|nr:hypothetical protein BHE74_00045440 [Ensete ventricosum]